MSIKRRAGAGRVRVDVFQSSAGRRVVGERLIARFARRTRSFTWNGRANRRGKRVRDGIYFVRFRVAGERGRVDVRRTLRRSNGRWSKRPAFQVRESCGLIAGFKLERAAFGGRSRRSLGISYKLGGSAPARVRLEVLRGRRVVARLADASRPAGAVFRARIGRSATRRGDYRIRLTARRGQAREVRVLVARRL